MVSVGSISLLFALVFLGAAIGWFLNRFLSKSQFSELEIQRNFAEKKLAAVTLHYKNLDSQHMQLQQLQNESSKVAKTLNNKSTVLAERCKHLEQGNNELNNKNTDIMNKITQLYQAKEAEISQLHLKIELAKSSGETAVTSTQEIQILKQTVERLENLLVEESASYESHISELEKNLSQMQPIDVLHTLATVKSDDLTKISGIGPKLNGFLREYGIVSFNQLANMSDEELQELSSELGDFGNRIFTDKWVEQAQLLND